MRTTKKQVEAAFARLHRAMEWPIGDAYTKDASGKLIAVPGVVLLQEYMGWWSVSQIVNEGGGETVLFRLGKGKSQAFETLANMASAVEQYKAARNFTQSGRAA